MREKAVKGIGVFLSLQLFRRAVTFTVSILLYRFLASRDFGLFALCESYIIVMSIFAEFGIDDVIVQNRSKEVGKVITVGFLVRVFCTLVSFVFIQLAADGFASWARHPELASPLRVMSLTLPINLLTFRCEMELKKNLRFEKFFWPEMMGGISSAVIALALAIMGWGVWALVMAAVLNPVVRAFILIRRFGQPLPHGSWDWKIFKSLLVKGKFSPVITLLYFLLAQSVHFFVARFVNLQSVGYFYLAFNWANFFVVYVVQFVGRVLFPAVAKIESDRPRVVNAYHEYLTRISLIAAPFGAGLAFVVPSLIPWLLGTQWTGAILICQMLSVHGYFRAIAAPSQTILYSLGQFKKISACLLIELACFWIFIYVGLKTGGLAGIAVGMAASKAIGFLLFLMVLERHLGNTLRKVLKAIVPSLLSSLVMVLSLASLRALFNASAWPAPFFLLFTALTGISIYLGSYGLFRPGGTAELKALSSDILKFIPKKSPEGK